MPIPITLFFAICGIAVVFIFFFQNKKQNKFAWTYLVLGMILILMALIPWTVLYLQEK
jgi:uncharacterized membrane protein